MVVGMIFVQSTYKEQPMNLWISKQQINASLSLLPFLFLSKINNGGGGEGGEY